MKVEYEKIKSGDRFLVWATVESVCRTEPQTGMNDVSVSLEDLSDRSSMEVELKHCEIVEYHYRKDIVQKTLGLLVDALNQFEHAIIKKLLNK